MSPWQHLRGNARWTWVVVDTVAIVALLVGVALALWSVYATRWLFVTVIGFGMTGAMVAAVAALRRWGAGTTALLTVLAWFVVGSPLVMPSATTAAILPTGRSLLGLVTGPVSVWRDMLTLAPPIGETFNLLAAPGLIALVGSVLAMSISLRSERPMLAWIPLAVGWSLAAALGTQAAFEPLPVGVAFFVVVLLWTSYRRAHLRASLTTGNAGFTPLRLVLGILTLAVAVAGTWFLAPLLSPEPSRATVRQAVEPPIDLEQFASPLQGFRANITKHQDEVMLEVAGLGEGDVLRVATLDKYDGLSFRVASGEDAELEATTFTRVGQWIAEDAPGVPRQASVTVVAYDDVWVPTMGKTTQISFEGARAITIGENFFYNRGSGTGLTPVGVRQGDRYRLELVSAARPSDDQIRLAAAGDVDLPEITGIPDMLRNRALTWTEGYSTAGEKALVLEENLRLGYFSHGQEDEVRSLSGHSQARLSALLADPERMVGDDEQYAAAMVLMARDIGIPARVIYGYRGSGSSSVTGEDVAAWAELNLEGLGWVVFDPTPPKDRVLDVEDTPPPPTPRPHIENPPPPPQEPEAPPMEEDMPIEPAEPPEEIDEINWGEIGTWAALIGIPFLTVILPIAIILGVKARRRSRRRSDPQVANRWAGAWAEIVDRARDMGRSPSGAATRTEQAEELVTRFPRVGERIDPMAISREADHMVFAPGEPSEDVARQYWTRAREVRKGLKRSVGGPRWLLSWLSTRSLRRRRQ